MKENCKECDINQIKKVCSILSLDKMKEKELDEEVEDYLKTVDMSKCNPEVMGEIWNIMSEIIDDNNPYREIKKYYNEEVMKIVPDVLKLIENGENRLETALKISICGNLIDFAAKHEFNLDMLLKKIEEVSAGKLVINDSQNMFEQLNDSDTLLYLGDNCGEIVLDKVFIEEIKRSNPYLRVFYGVRGKAIVNDVTIDDAEMVHMNECAEVISNGDGGLGTVLKNTSTDFKRIYDMADIVICKGQGNYESLLSSDKENLYFLFMAKCENVTQPLNIPDMSIICLKNRKGLIW